MTYLNLYRKDGRCSASVRVALRFDGTEALTIEDARNLLVDAYSDAQPRTQTALEAFELAMETLHNQGKFGKLVCD